MTHLYVILSFAGWAWAVLFGAFLLFRLRRRDGAGEPSEAGERHEG
jgi:hypothetical protein